MSLNGILKPEMCFKSSLARYVEELRCFRLQATFGELDLVSVFSVFAGLAGSDLLSPVPLEAGLVSGAGLDSLEVASAVAGLLSVPFL